MCILLDFLCILDIDLKVWTKMEYLPSYGSKITLCLFTTVKLMTWSTLRYDINKRAELSTDRVVYGSCSRHLRKPSVRFSLTLISPLAEFTYFLMLQIVVLWVLQSPIISRLTDMFILSIVGLNGKPSLSLCHGILLRKERRTISSVAVGVYK
jgi:hypothetical protein